jgi:hypothetical protein
VNFVSSMVASDGIRIALRKPPHERRDTNPRRSMIPAGQSPLAVNARTSRRRRGFFHQHSGYLRAERADNECLRALKRGAAAPRLSFYRLSAVCQPIVQNLVAGGAQPTVFGVRAGRSVGPSQQLPSKLRHADASRQAQRLCLLSSGRGLISGNGSTKDRPGCDSSDVSRRIA